MLNLLALGLATAAHVVRAQTPGSFADGGKTGVSAMMMFVGNDERVYILDKSESNAEQINGHPAWGSVWDINTHQFTVMDVLTNTFCAAGMHLPNGSFVTFGGNGAIGPGGKIGSVLNDGGASAAYDAQLQDYDGAKSIRILNPCKTSDNFNDPNCQWFDNPQVLSMQKKRWYAATEALADGSVVIIGGFVNGGYINRNFPVVDPNMDLSTQGGAAEPTFEFYPSRGPATNMQFVIETSGLNSYAHTFLMPSGKMFVQANLSTILWDYNGNVETPLPPMPNGVARVYPASGATAMLPLTPANNWNPTIIFCGGSDLAADDYGNYSFPAVNTWEHPASSDCQTITPEPTDGSAPAYSQEDDMPAGRTMGQFIILPTGKLLVVNGGANGTAGYATATGQTPSVDQMPFAESLASGPVGQPAIYDPKAAKGQRWSRQGLSSSNIARLYHSSAMLLPDASVLIAGGNPNIEVNLTTPYPTEYRAEIFYPPYFAAKTRPQPSGIPSTLSYGGQAFDVKIPASSYSGSANDAADNTTVVVQRGGFTTHAMNMGQRLLQLNNTYTVNSDGSITLHVAQMPPNANLFTPGPGWVFVVVNGIPSKGSYVIVGNGQIGTQPTSDASSLPQSVRLDSAKGSADASNTQSSGGGGSSTSHTGLIVGGIVGALALIGVIGGLAGMAIARKRRQAAATAAAGYPMVGMGGFASKGHKPGPSDSSSFVPLAVDTKWGAAGAGAGMSSASLHSPYKDDEAYRASTESFDPYTQRAMGTATPTQQYAAQPYGGAGYGQSQQYGGGQSQQYGGGQSQQYGGGQSQQYSGGGGYGQAQQYGGFSQQTQYGHGQQFSGSSGWSGGSGGSGGQQQQYYPRR